jgi:hypothetical protein
MLVLGVLEEELSLVRGGELRRCGPVALNALRGAGVARRQLRGSRLASLRGSGLPGQSWAVSDQSRDKQRDKSERLPHRTSFGGGQATAV